MNETPTTTLTQRRSQITVDGTKKIMPKEKLNTPRVDAGDPAERGSVIRIVLWILVMVFIGVGTALLITNLARNDSKKTENNSNNSTDNTPESFPVAEEPNTETPDGEDPDAEEPTEEPAEEPATEEPVPTPVTADITKFDNTDRQRTSSANSNNIILNNFKFYVENGVFNYIFYNVTTTEGAIDPAAKLYYEGDDLIFEMNNIYRDNVTGQGGTTSRNIAGIAGLTGTQTESRGNVSKYKFLLNSKLKSRMEVDAQKREIRVQIQL